jgi:hypothetical protein
VEKNDKRGGRHCALSCRSCSSRSTARFKNCVTANFRRPSRAMHQSGFRNLAQDARSIWGHGPPLGQRFSMSAVPSGAAVMSPGGRRPANCKAPDAPPASRTIQLRVHGAVGFLGWPCRRRRCYLGRVRDSSMSGALRNASRANVGDMPTLSRLRSARRSKKLAFNCAR